MTKIPLLSTEKRYGNEMKTKEYIDRKPLRENVRAQAISQNQYNRELRKYTIR